MALNPIMPILDRLDIVFASSSKSRKEVLERNVGLRYFAVVPPSDRNENLGQNFGRVEDIVMRAAYVKAEEVRRRLEEKCRKPDLIIAADTRVSFGGALLGKPGTTVNAKEVLTRLSGNLNTVYTGVVIITGQGDVERFYEKTNVQFGQITEEQINSYIETREPLGMAGAYGIQEKGGSFIEAIQGDYFNILGLPAFKFCMVIDRLVRENKVVRI